ncbi:RecB family exonuclease [Pseudonocardia sp. N23]|nr:RecB family exonuclease [Pseudonocardia sp. N23]
MRRRPALSPSRASDFRACPLLYRFRAIDRLPEHPTPAQLRGTLVHSVLERLFALPAPERTPAAATALVGPAWVDLVIAWPAISDALFGPLPAATEAAAGPATANPRHGPGEPRPVEAGTVELRSPDPGSTDAGTTGGPANGDGPAGADAAAREDRIGFADWFGSARDLVEAYFALEDPREVTADAVELRVESDLGDGLLLRGFVDRVDALPDGGLRVVDYKTGRSPGEYGEAAAMFQLKFYALTLLHERGVVPGELRLLYLRSGEWLSYSPDRGELERFSHILAALWDAIRAAGRTGDFAPRRGSACRFCAHRAVCPEWGGTPPPYPGWPDVDPDLVTAPPPGDT